MASPLTFPRFRAFTQTGEPLAGGRLYSYIATTSTPQNTYTDASLAVANSNPVILDANGEASVWIGTALYKFVLKDANDVTQWTVDNVSQSGVSSAGASSSEWLLFSGTPTYVSATQFSVTGDQTATFQVGRRIKTTNSGGTVYASVSAVVFSSVTTVTVVNDAGAMDSGLSAVSYALLTASPASVPLRSFVRQSVEIQSSYSSGTMTQYWIAFSTPNYDRLSETTFGSNQFVPRNAGSYRLAINLRVRNQGANAGSITSLAFGLLKNGAATFAQSAALAYALAVNQEYLLSWAFEIEAVPADTLKPFFTVVCSAATTTITFNWTYTISAVS